MLSTTNAEGGRRCAGSHASGSPHNLLAGGPFRFEHLGPRIYPDMFSLAQAQAPSTTPGGSQTRTCRGASRPMLRTSWTPSGRPRTRSSGTLELVTTTSASATVEQLEARARRAVERVLASLGGEIPVEVVPQTHCPVMILAPRARPRI